MGVFADGFFYVFIYMPIYFLFTLIQRLYWICSGKQDIVSQIEVGQLYERSAHVLDIQWKVKKEPFQLLNRFNFIATHRSFEHPSYVLRNNISLLTVQLDMAIFVETPFNYNIFDCRASPFVHLGQFDKASRIITLPLSSLITLGEEIGDPQMKIIWLHSTGRCGSTALSQVFKAIPNCITLSEPMCLFTYTNFSSAVMSYDKYKQLLQSDMYAEIVRATVRLLCKPTNHNPEMIFIKNFTLSGVNEVPVLERLFPSHTHMFLYRDCLPTVQSYIRSLNSHFWMNLVLSLRKHACSRYVFRISHLLIQSLASPKVIEEHDWVNDAALQLQMTDFGLLVLQWASFCAYYCMLYEASKTKLRAIRYEDILERRHETLALMFEFCGISLQHLDAAKKSLEADSQAGTTLSRSTLCKHKKTHLSEELQSEANLYLKAFHLPPLKTPAFLPGTLTPREGAINSGSFNNHSYRSDHITIQVES